MNAERRFDDLLGIRKLGPRVSVLFGGKSDRDGLPDYRLAQLASSIATEFKQMVLRSLAAKSEERERHEIVLREYDAQYKPGDYEVVWIELGRNDYLSRLIRLIPVPAQTHVFDADSDALADVRFFVVTVQDSMDHDIRCFRTINPSKKLSETEGIPAVLRGRRFEKIEDVSLIFEPDFQVIAYREYVFIFAQFGFETLFQFYEDLREVGDQTLNEIERRVPISNFDAFRTDAMQHLIKIRKLRNILRSSHLSRLNMSKLKVTIKDYGSPMEVVRENGVEKLKYDPSEPWAILELLEDQFVKSPTTEIKYAANSKREIKTPK